MNSFISYWITIFSSYGWFLLIPLIERIWYIHKQPFFRSGLISDFIHTYQVAIFQFILATSSPVLVEGILTTSISINIFPSQGDGFLQNSLANQSLLINLITLMIIGEIAFYTAHYYCHKIPFLWEFHRVHHSSVTVDSFSTSRFHIFDRLLFNLPLLVFMAYLGPSPNAIIFYFFFRGFMDRYIHSNINGPRWTHKFMLSSPHFHRWHHTPDPAVRDHNFSGDFIFLDVLFGTAYDPDPKDKPPPSKFGEPGYTNNFFMQQLMPFIFLYKKTKTLLKN